VIEGVSTAIQTAVQTATDIVQTAITTAWSVIVAASENDFGRVPEILSKAWDDIKKTFNTGVEEVKKIFNGVIGDLKKIGTDLANTALGIGSDIIDGIKKGISNGVGALKDAVKNAANDALNAAKRTLGIASPSKAFAELGGFTMQGMALGVARESPKAVSAVSGAMRSVVGCDPLAFAQAAPREQRDTLMRVTGLDKSLAALDDKRASALKDKQRAETVLQVANVSLASIPVVDGPDAEVSAAELLSQAAEASSTNAKHARARAWLRGKKDEAGSLASDIAICEAKLADLRGKLGAVEKEIAAQTPVVEAMVDADVQAIQERIKTVEADNAKARDRAARRAAEKSKQEASAAFSSASRAVEAIDAERRLAIESAPMPVKGLAFEDDAVTLDKIPLAQVNSARQIQVGVALALAEKKPIRVVFTRYGSLLDQHGMEALRAIAVEHGAQVFVERVSDAGGDGLCIVDGEAVAGGEA
jgi:hypothetical protein